MKLIFTKPLLESRIGDLEKSKGEELLFTNEDDTKVFSTAREILDYFSTHISKKYLQWVVEKYINREFRIKKSSEIKDLCNSFDKIMHHIPIDKRNILLYSIDEVIELSDAHDKNNRLKFHLKNGTATIFYKAGDVTVFYPLTKKAGYELGEKGDWCVSTRTEDRNRFNDYISNGELFFIDLHGDWYCLYLTHLNNNHTPSEYSEFKDSGNNTTYLVDFSERDQQLLLNIFDEKAQEYGYNELIKDEEQYLQSLEKQIEVVLKTDKITLYHIDDDEDNKAIGKKLFKINQMPANIHNIMEEGDYHLLNFTTHTFINKSYILKISEDDYYDCLRMYNNISKTVKWDELYNIFDSYPEIKNAFKHIKSNDFMWEFILTNKKDIVEYCEMYDVVTITKYDNIKFVTFDGVNLVVDGTNRLNLFQDITFNGAFSSNFNDRDLYFSMYKGNEVYHCRISDTKYITLIDTSDNREVLFDTFDEFIEENPAVIKYLKNQIEHSSDGWTECYQLQKILEKFDE